MADENTGVETPEAGVETLETDVEQEDSSTSGELADDAGQQEEFAKEKQGLIEARQAEARKRQEIEIERDFLRNEFQRLQQSPAEEIAPDELLTKEQIDQQFGSFKNYVDTQQRHLANQNSVLAAGRKHEDFDKVYELADKLCKEKPYMVNVLLSSDNVGEAIYEYGKTHKDYSKDVIEKTVEKIKKNLNRAPTLSDSTGRSVADLDKANYYMTRSKEEHDADVRKRLGLD